MLAAFVLSYIFGVAGYLYAYDDTNGNILLNFDPTDKLILLGRVGCGVTLMAAIPMVAVPCRDALLALPLQYHSWRHTSRERIHRDQYKVDEHTVLLPDKDNKKGSTPAGEEQDSEMEQAVPTSTNDNFLYVTFTFLIVFLAFVGATWAPGVATVWSICGSSMAFLVAFILPSACYIKIRHERKGHGHRIIMSAWILLMFSIVGAIACTVQTIWRLCFSSA